jgi:hypothetical protein
MGYREWFDQHGAKHRALVAKLAHLSDAELIAYFRYDNMVIHEPDFCPLYAEGKRCHTMEDLNCYLCACPYFRFDDAGLDRSGERVRKSTCAIAAKEGAQIQHDNVIHQDCSACLLPHRTAFIAHRFDRDWFAIMAEVPPKELPNETEV